MTVRAQDRILIERTVGSNLSAYNSDDVALQGFLIEGTTNGSTVLHTVDDNGLGPSFVMSDLSTLESPAVSTEFTEEENTSFALHGGAVSMEYRYDVLAPIGESNGLTALTWDRNWDSPLTTYFDQYEGIVVESITDATGVGIDLVMHRDSGNITANIPNYDSAEYLDLVMVFDPTTGEIRVIHNGGLIPSFSETDFRTTDTSLCYDAALRTSCGSVNGTTVVKMLKRATVLSFLDEAVFTLTPSDFRSNRLVHATGFRELTIEVPSDQTLEPGAITEFELLTANKVTIRRGLNESQVLVDFLPDRVYAAVQRGKVICGNMPAVVGYTAYFTQGLIAETIVAAVTGSFDNSFDGSFL
jgi:hypothetical protein